MKPIRTEPAAKIVITVAARYLCKNCHHHFYDNAVTFPRMRVDSHVIVTSLNMYYSGLSTRKVAEQLSNIFGEHVSQSTAWFWIHKYSELVGEYVKDLKPKLSGKYHRDEAEIVVGGEGRYFWETIDEDSRMIVAHLLTESRTNEDAKKVFQQASEVQKPTTLYIMVLLRMTVRLTKFSIRGTKQIELNGLGKLAYEQGKQTT